MAPQEFEIDSMYPVVYQLPNTIQLADKSLVSSHRETKNIPYDLNRDSFFKRIRGAVSKTDLEAFSSFTRRVGSFILTDAPLHLHECTIPPGTYIRLSQIRNPEAPFFPSLKHLRIIDADSALDTHLNFLLTDSLQSIELVNLSDSNQEVFSSFLVTLADECPRLSTITLGQDPNRRLSSSLLNDCLNFSHLRELELKDVLSELDFQLLVTIGRTLPELESFILNARTAEYSLRLNSTQPTADTDGHTPAQDVPQEGERPSTRYASPESPSPVPISVPSFAFSNFGRCPSPSASIFGWGSAPPAPIPGQCPSPNHFGAPLISRGPLSSAKPVEAESLASSPQLTDEDEPPSSPQAGKAEASSVPPPSFARLKRLHVAGELALIKDLVGSTGSAALEDMALTLVRSTPPKIVQAWDEVTTYSTYKGRKRASTTKVRMADKVVDMETPSFVSLVEEAIHTTWKDTLTKLFIGQHETYAPGEQDTTSPILQFSTIAKILSLPTLEALEVSGWRFDSVSTPLSQLSPKLKVFHLPVGIENHGISLSDLRLIAESCPNIISLQTGIINLESIPAYGPFEGASHALSHGLEILSVGNASENSNQKDILDIARHLFILFPYLKEIRTHEGQNKEQWMYIHSLVQLLQTGRLDDAARVPACKN